MKPSKNFYQWDINQKFTECDGRFVDFIINEKVIYRVDIVNGECIIPDEFLQKSGYHTVYECMSDYTIQNHMFPVHPREKPPSYVYTPTEKLTFEGLVQKVNDTVADIIRRADSGEFDGYTPVKGKDYFTESEKNEMVQSVASGAVGEFREIVDSATADFNKNSSVKTNDYNTNAETKTAEFDANASEKLTTYDVNAEQQTTDYNRNAEQKLQAYNQNHTEKVAEYNANAETKKAEFDSNAAALQTEVDRLRGECDTLAAENRKQENRISALMKLNKGQTYDILPEEGETVSRTAPSGAKYVSVDKVGGKSVVWNQLIDYTKLPPTKTDNGITYDNNMDGTFTATGTAENVSFIAIPINVISKHHYFSMSIQAGDTGLSYIAGDAMSQTVYDRGDGALSIAIETGIAYFVLQRYNAGDVVAGEIAKPQLYDLTQMFGAGNEPTIEQFKKIFAQKIYPYNSGEIISGTTANVELEGKNLWDDSNPAFTQVLLNAGFLYNSGVWNTNNIVYSSDNIGTIPPQSVLSYDILADAGLNPRIELFSGENRILSRNLESTGKWIHHNLNIPSGTVIDRIVVNYVSRGMCKIKNIQLERGTTETAYSPHTKQSLSTGFPELKSAGTAHDEIDMDGGTIRRNIGAVDLGTLTWDNNGTFEDGNVQFIARVPGRAYTTNGLCDKFEKSEDNALGTYTLRTTGDQITFTASEGTEINAFIESVSGAILYYEVATPTTEQVTIPEPLQEWLPVEPGGTVTFRNADDSKQLAVPNGVSWVRKLDEVE